MKKFEESKIEVIELGNDIITTSDAGAGAGQGQGGGASMCEIMEIIDD